MEASSMKLTISREIIVQLVAKLYSIVPAKPVLPILSNLLLEAKKEGEITLSATDLMVSMKVQGNAYVDEEGSATIPAKRFFSLIREFTTDRIEISYADNEITIQSGASYFKLYSMPSTDFPAISTFYEVDAFTLPSLLLKDALRRVSFAAARDDTLNVYNGVFFRMEKNLLTLIGTDGKKLAKLMLPFNMAIPERSDFVIPLKGIEEIEKVLDGNKEVSIVFLPDKVILRLEHITLFIKLLSEKFPDVEKIIPNPKEMTSLVLHREELISLLRQVSLFTSEMLSSVAFIFENNELHLFAVNAEIGEGRASMPVNYTGNKLEIAFHPTYFLDILRHSKDETIQLHITDCFNPGLITDSTSTLFVIMPMRVRASTVHVS